MQTQSIHKDRNSAVELLRLFSVCGIICMHIYGHVTKGVVDLAYYAFINTLCNCGVSLFVLISGFYTIKPTISGGIKIVMVTIFYSVLSYVLKTPRGGITLKELIRSTMPISAQKYWFISAYFVLFCFSDLLNKALDSLDQKQHMRVILRFGILFVIAPTITFLHIMGDGGKGICNMLLMYIIGRYIGKYYKSFQRKSYILHIMIVLIAGVAINFTTGYFVPKDGVPYAPLAKDSSVITVTLSILIFLEVIRHNFTSRFINRIAMHTLSIYLFEGVLEGFFLNTTGLWNYKGEWYYIFSLILCAGGIGLCCCLVDEVRCFLFIPIQRSIKKYESKIQNKIRQASNYIIDKICF